MEQMVERNCCECLAKVWKFVQMQGSRVWRSGVAGRGYIRMVACIDTICSIFIYPGVGEPIGVVRVLFEARTICLSLLHAEST